MSRNRSAATAVLITLPVLLTAFALGRLSGQAPAPNVRASNPLPVPVAPARSQVVSQETYQQPARPSPTPAMPYYAPPPVAPPPVEARQQTPPPIVYRDIHNPAGDIPPPDRQPEIVQTGPSPNVQEDPVRLPGVDYIPGTNIRGRQGPPPGMERRVWGGGELGQMGATPAELSQARQRGFR